MNNLLRIIQPETELSSSQNETQAVSPIIVQASVAADEAASDDDDLERFRPNLKHILSINSMWYYGV
jgi:hypothetical protein